MDSLPGSPLTPINTPSGFAPNSPQANAATAQSNLNNSLMSILNDPTQFSENALNDLRQPSYHFKLFMTTEHELITGANSGSLTDLYSTLDSLPQAIIAESGVTAGFNISEVTMEEAAGPGWRNKNCCMTSMQLTIIEPLGTSLMEAILSSAMALGVSNYNKMWYYLELTFRAYNDDGSINASPLDGMNLPNGGRWIYQITFTEVNMAMSEAGTVWTISCVPFGMTGFEDNTSGRTPDMMTAKGKTIQDFCNDFATNLTKKWTDRYLGEIYKFNIVIKDIQDANGLPNPGTFKLKKSEQDPIRNLALDDATGVPISQIAAKTSIIDVITFLYAYCEEAQSMILDTNSPNDLEDTTSDSSTSTAGGDIPTATYKGKTYRVPIVPVIECDTKVTGYDPITGQYMKEFTYVVWAYRSYTSNMSASQFQNVKKAGSTTATDVTKDLINRGFLKKRYYYQFTGLNTEILRMNNFDYNFQFASILPKLTGWRQDFLATSVHQKVNPAIGTSSNFTGSSTPSEISNKGAGASSSQSGTPGAPGTGGATGSTSPTIQAQSQTQTYTIAQIQQKLPSYQQQIDNLNAVLNNPSSPSQTNPSQPMTAQERQGLQQQLVSVTAARDNLVASAKADREAYNAQSKSTRDQIEALGPTKLYSEDAINGSSSFNMTYLQAHSEPDDGAGHDGQWHRGASLVGALMNQMFEPSSSSFLQIEMEVRGDPYWIGYSNLERRAVMNGNLPLALDSTAVLPNYQEGDSTIALVFRFPQTIDPQTGAPVLRGSDIFNGLYRVVNVKNMFTNGEFKQVLNANKLELINPVLTNPQNGTGGGNITPSSTPTVSP